MSMDKCPRQNRTGVLIKSNSFYHSFFLSFTFYKPNPQLRSAAVGGVTAISPLQKRKIEREREREKKQLLRLLSGEFSKVAHDVCTPAANVGPKAE